MEVEYAAPYPSLPYRASPPQGGRVAGRAARVRPPLVGRVGRALDRGCVNLSDQTILPPFATITSSMTYETEAERVTRPGIEKLIPLMAKVLGWGRVGGGVPGRSSEQSASDRDCGRSCRAVERKV